jgi:beta-lactamase regulating signal transducer with metallopeptidase domain
MIKQIIKTVLMSVGLSMLCLAVYLAIARPESFTHYELGMTFISCTIIVLLTMSDWFKVVTINHSTTSSNDPAAVNDKNDEKVKKNDGKATNF